MTSNKTDAETAKSVADAQKLIKEIIASRFTPTSQGESYSFVNNVALSGKRKQMQPLQANFLTAAAENEKLVNQLNDHFMGSTLPAKQLKPAELKEPDVKPEDDITSSAGESLQIDVGDGDITGKDTLSIDGAHSKPLSNSIEEILSTPLPLKSPQNFLITELKPSENQQIVLTEDQLAEMPVKDLNALLRGLPETEVLKLKQRRRTIKNRGYAQTSRTKKTTQKTILETEKYALETLLQSIKKENEILKRERDEARIKLEAFERFAGMSGIVIMDRNNTSETTSNSSNLCVDSVANTSSSLSHTESNNNDVTVSGLHSNNADFMQNVSTRGNLITKSIKIISSIKK